MFRKLFYQKGKTFYWLNIFLHWFQAAHLRSVKKLRIMWNRFNLIPLSLSNSIVVKCLISCSIGKREDENSMSSSILPGSIHDISILVRLKTGTMLFTLLPWTSENVTISKIVGTIPVPMICRKISNVFVPCSEMLDVVWKTYRAMGHLKFKNLFWGGGQWYAHINVKNTII